MKLQLRLLIWFGRLGFCLAWQWNPWRVWTEISLFGCGPTVVVNTWDISLKNGWNIAALSKKRPLPIPLSLMEGQSTWACHWGTWLEHQCLQCRVWNTNFGPKWQTLPVMIAIGWWPEVVNKSASLVKQATAINWMSVTSVHSGANRMYLSCNIGEREN